MMPAMRAVPSTSPFLDSPRRIVVRVSGCMVTEAAAMAVRSVSGLPPTSTMFASPEASRCVSSPRLITAGRRPAGGVAEQVARRGCNIVLPHQALAHEKGAHAMCAEPHAIGMGEDAALGNQQPVGRDHGGESL